MCLNNNEKAQTCLLLVRGLLFPCLNGALAEKFQRRCSHPLSELVSASKDLVGVASTAKVGCAMSAIAQPKTHCMSWHMTYSVFWSGPHGRRISWSHCKKDLGVISVSAQGIRY